MKDKGLKDYGKFIHTPKRCKRCRRTMKNPKHYRLGDVYEYPNGFWTFRKFCKRCNTENIGTKEG